MSLGFVWVVMHGIWAGSPASRLIHEFAQSWRNYRERNVDPMGNEFQTVPHKFNASEIGAWAAVNMMHWNDLRHGPLRLGVTTEQPQVPSLLYPAATDARRGPLRLSNQPQVQSTTYPEAVELVDAEMKDGETVELTTEDIAGIQLPPSNPGSPLSTPASPPADKQGEGESGPTASVTPGTTPSSPPV
ncbi:hypothetical protein C8R47DRAFT_1229094 [Mycena vitilis]|nr:hypothetical protein C8R47DRAFT_1229094 [Mycena vitilis]